VLGALPLIKLTLPLLRLQLGSITAQGVLQGWKAVCQDMEIWRYGEPACTLNLDTEVPHLSPKALFELWSS
jgi:hypothetical protein